MSLDAVRATIGEFASLDDATLWEAIDQALCEQPELYSSTPWNMQRDKIVRTLVEVVIPRILKEREAERWIHCEHCGRPGTTDCGRHEGA